MNSCNYTESYCAEYGTRPTTRLSSVTVKFKNSARLSAGQTERFELVGAQVGNSTWSTEFSLKPINTQKEYEISSRERFFTDGNVITVREKK